MSHDGGTITPAQQLQAMLNSPVMKPPPNQSAQLDTGPINMPGYIAIVVIFGLISTLTTGMRLYTKIVVMKSPGLEDLFAALGWALFLAYITLCGFVVQHGALKHMWDLRVYQFIDLLYYIYVTESLFGVANIFLKTSILMQYRTIFSARKKSFTWWNTHILTGIIVVFYIVITFCQIFTCTPRSKFWNILETDGFCLDTTSIQLAAGMFNAVSDVLIFLVPQGVIWKLHLPLKRKLGISGIFFIGIIACITSAIRAYYTFQLLWSKDTSYTISEMGYWTVGEVFCGVLCASLPMMPRFSQHLAATKYGLSLKSSFRSLLSSKRTQQSGFTDNDQEPFAMNPRAGRSLDSRKQGYDNLEEQEFRNHVHIKNSW